MMMYRSHAWPWSRLARIFVALILSLVTVELLLASTLLPNTTIRTGARRPLLAAFDTPIPRQIWQIFFSPPHAEDLDKRALFASEWISMTPGYAYSLLNTLEADQFINTTFTSRPEIAQTYHALKNPGAKSDFLRYLLLLTHGGIYTDLDTQPLVGPEDWLPEHKRRDAAIIIGLESDSSRDHGPGFPDYPVQFCQWTIAAAPNHPILHRMVNRTIEALKHLAQEQRTTLDQVRLGDEDVLQLSGPRAWSEVVLAGIKELDATVTGLSDLQRMDEPRYYRDIAVMPVLSFRADYLCSWGLRWGLATSRKCLVRHMFKGAWRTK